MTVLTQAASTSPTLTQGLQLALAFVLCAVIGLEREAKHKSTGLRTHTIVGLGAALFTLVGAWGFGDRLGPGTSFDPTRVAAQVVTGIGFIGGGVIFVHRDAVRGLTTAATVWLTAAVGMACGAGLPLLAMLATAGHFAVVFGLSPLADRLPMSPWAPSLIRLLYVDGHGVLRNVLAECTARGFSVVEVSTDRPREEPDRVVVYLHVRGKGSKTDLVGALSELDWMVRVTTGEDSEGE